MRQYHGIPPQGLENLFRDGEHGRLQCVHALRRAAMLRRLNDASNATGMSLPGWGLHPLQGCEIKGHFSAKISGNWRMTFKFDGTDCWSTIKTTTLEIHHGTHV